MAASPSLQRIVDDLNAAQDWLDLALERLGAAIDQPTHRPMDNHAKGDRPFTQTLGQSRPR